MTLTPTLEDRFALKDALLDYLYAVDALDNLDTLAECFTEDATLDLSGLELGIYHGEAEIRGFYAKVLDTMTHHMHTLSNFRVKDFSPDSARCHAYICGMGHSRSGTSIQVYVYYDLLMAKTARGWKISHFYEAPQLPMPASVTAVHGA